jgi:hypothetical protein
MQHVRKSALMAVLLFPLPWGWSGARRAAQELKLLILLDDRGELLAHVLVEALKLENVQLSSLELNHVGPRLHQVHLHRANEHSAAQYF